MYCILIFTGFSKFTVSQNVDGLHRRSGIPPSELSELHGNTNLETCKTCGRQYLRDFETRYELFLIGLYKPFKNESTVEDKIMYIFIECHLCNEGELFSFEFTIHFFSL